MTAGAFGADSMTRQWPTFGCATRKAAKPKPIFVFIRGVVKQQMIPQPPALYLFFLSTPFQ